MAGRFSDVPDTSLSRGAIERLADRGVINGNPDGTFAPNKTVNRAELLTMLYRAAKLSPSLPQAVCKKDIIAGSWYLDIVCDAISRGFVKGYDDGTFRPGNAVNRVEALKMISTVLTLNLETAASGDTSMIAFPDVSLSAWYASYLAGAYRLGILPVAGQSADRFGPEQPLTRAEAALYIDAALTAKDHVVSSSSSSSSSSSEEEQQSSSVMTRSSQSSSSSSIVSAKTVTFPMSEAGVWSKIDATLYRFTLSAKTVGDFSVLSGNEANMTCRLYKLDANGLSTEYYIGLATKGKCSLRATMTSGDYQLELKGAASDSFTLTSRKVTGDANDGYSDAKTLLLQSTRVGTLEVDDLADYYTFKVGVQSMLFIEMSNTQTVRCTIIPGSDVDLFGFQSPNCTEQFLYTPGTYTVVIDRQPGVSLKLESYGVVLKQVGK